MPYCPCRPPGVHGVARDTLLVTKRISEQKSNQPLDSQLVVVQLCEEGGQVIFHTLPRCSEGWCAWLGGSLTRTLAGDAGTLLRALEVLKLSLRRTQLSLQSTQD